MAIDDRLQHCALRLAGYLLSAVTPCQHASVPGRSIIGMAGSMLTAKHLLHNGTDLGADLLE
jgi:hypothetical protein